MSLKPYFLDKGYVCPVCPRVFTNAFGLRLHAPIHLRDECPICHQKNYSGLHFYRSCDPHHMLLYAVLPKNHRPYAIRQWAGKTMNLLKVTDLMVNVDTRKIRSQLVLYVGEDQHKRMISEACKTLRKNLEALPPSSPSLSPVHRLAAPYA